MVRFTVLASGSKGNATVLCGGGTRILVDCGLSCRELFRRMRLLGEEPETLDAILITHEHSDHVGGVAVTARKLGIPVYFTEGTHRAWMRWISPRKQMTYAQWMEQVRKQTAERQAEAAETEDKGEADENDLVEAASLENEPQVLRLATLAQDDSKEGAEPLSSISSLESPLRLAILRSVHLRLRTMQPIRWVLFFGRKGCASAMPPTSVTLHPT
jgi:ribonuclease BN (tRNA processing enzyme)